MKKTHLILCLLASASSSCSQQSDPLKLTSEDMVAYENVIYSVVDNRELKLDIVLPKYLNSPAPAIVDFPGGAWRICNKSVDDARLYTEYGFVGVSVEYRTSDIAIFPAAVHDCKAAIRFLRAHAKEYNINPDKIGVTGISAGAYFAALLGTSDNDKYLEGDGGYPQYSSTVQAVVDHFGPIDFLNGNDTTGLGLKNINSFSASESPGALFLGGPIDERKEMAKLASPLSYIDANDPPVLIIHGEKDGMVIIRQSELLFEALKKAEVECKMLRVKNADHQYRSYMYGVQINPSTEEIIGITIEWFQKCLGIPDLDVNLIQKLQKERQSINASKKTNLYYKLTIDLPGKRKESYCEGQYTILCEGKVLDSGEITLKDFSTNENRTFQKEIIITGTDLQSKKIMWNFRGMIFDSELSEKYEPMYMQEEIFNQSIEGIGFNIHIGEDKSFKIDKVVFRK